MNANRAIPKASAKAPTSRLAGAFRTLALLAGLSAPASPVWAVHGFFELPSEFWDLVILALAIFSGVLMWLAFRCHQNTRRLEQARANLTGMVAERDMAVAAAAEREALFRHLFEQTQVGIFRSTLDGERYLVANDAIARMYGLDSAESFLRSVTPRALYATPEQRSEMMERLRRDGCVTNFEMQAVRADGSIGVVLASVYLNAEAGWLEGTVIDVSALHSAYGDLDRQHRFLRKLLNAIPNPVFYKDAQGVYRLLNEAFERMMGKAEDELVGRDVYDISPPELARKYEEMDNALLKAAGQATQRYEYQVQAEQGLRSVVFFKESVLDDAGGIEGLVGTIADVTQLREKERELRLATTRYRDILDNAVEGIAEFSGTGAFLDLNTALARMFGYASPEELLDDTRDDAAKLFAEPDRLQELLQRVHERGHVQRFEIEIRHRDGGTRWLSLSLCGVHGSDGRLEGMHGLALDVTLQRAEHAELSRMANTDVLTGLANRASMRAQLDRMVAQARERGLVLGVLFLDLDGFKDINDQWGHQAGDGVLIQVAERIRRRLRRNDVLARLGGDEFAIILWDLGGEDNLRSVVVSVLHDMQEPFECQGALCALGASIGASLFPEHAAGSTDLLALADQAMYKVKRLGKNGLCVHGGDAELLSGN